MFIFLPHNVGMKKTRRMICPNRGTIPVPARPGQGQGLSLPGLREQPADKQEGHQEWLIFF